MCGIIGFTGKKEASEILIKGLEHLEYRGYDSAGIALKAETSNIQVIKSQGKVKNLKDKVIKSGVCGNCGIGHTRWATHGEANEINAHPHISSDGKIAVVHNGIIENYKEIKAELEKSGIKFVSQTDTEVVAHLLRLNYNGDMISTIIKTVKRLTGSFALGIICCDFDKNLYCVRKDSPLVVGKSSDGTYISSDISALKEFTEEIYELENYGIASLEEEKITFYGLDGKEKENKALAIGEEISSVSKGIFESYMLKEINEEPLAFENTVKRYINTEKSENGEFLLKNMPLTKSDVERINHISIVACGTAYHAGLAAEYLFERYLRIRTEGEVASEYRYKEPITDENELVIVISQSGETADTVAAMREAKKRGAKVLAVCNVKNSTVWREADYKCLTCAGQEIAVASTKAYIAQLAVLYLLFFDFAYKKNIYSADKINILLAEFIDLSEKIHKTIAQYGDICQNFSGKVFNGVFFIGRGLDRVTAAEASLKLKEISYIHSEGIAAGELKHGTIALMDKNTLVIAIATQDELFEKTVSNIAEVKARGATVLALTAGKNIDEADFVWQIPKTNKILGPIISILPMQLLSYYTAKRCGCDIDKPRNLAKK